MPFPGGESLDDAARRYARADRGLLERPEQAVLVVCHEIPIRYALNAAAGSDDLDGPEHLDPERHAVPVRRELALARRGPHRKAGRVTTTLPTRTAAAAAPAGRASGILAIEDLHSQVLDLRANRPMRARGLEPPRAFRLSGT